MFNFAEIIKENRASFYDYSSGETNPVWKIDALKLFIAFIFALLFCKLSKDFLDATVTVYSILIGFSFNILFYLLATSKMQKKDDGAIEDEIQIDKINTITKELFYNVSYFNITSISVIIAALVFFLFDSRLPQFINENMQYFSDVKIWKVIEPKLIYVRSAILFTYRFLFYYLLIESLYTFVRTSGRVSFYFRQKIAADENKV